MAIKPYGDRILIEPIDEEDAMTASGIVIPDTAAKDRIEKGIILETGEGGRNEAGTVVPVRVKAGQKVFFSKPYGADEIKIGEKKCLFIKEDDILAIID